LPPKSIDLRGGDVSDAATVGVEVNRATLAGGAARDLIRSMLLIGGANVANIAIAIVRQKIVALLLGPTGVGLLGIYSNLLGVVAQGAGLGLSSSGVRDIASASGDPRTAARARAVLFGGLLLQGLAAMAAVWLLRAPIARSVFGSTDRAYEVGLVGVAVLLNLLGSSQSAILQGMRRIADLSRLTVLSGLAGTLAGLPLVWIAGENGLVWFVLVQALAAFAVGSWFTRRLMGASRERMALGEALAIWRSMAGLGSVFMVGGVAGALTLLAARAMIVQRLGIAEAGLFAAAWGVSMLYIGFLLDAMSADYYPRLAETIRDRSAAARLVNDQTQLGLAIGGPALLLLIGCAPWAVALLYSGRFLAAVDILQWQLAGNVLKLASWPIVFIIVAMARSWTFLLVELSWNAIFLAILTAGLPVVGLQITGFGFFCAYAAYLAIVYATVRRIYGFRWAPLSLGLIAAHTALALATLAVGRVSPIGAAALGAALAVVTGLTGLRIVLAKVGGGRLAKRLSAGFAAVGWPMEIL
jgi:PST family polysaccharide transporter